MRASQQQQRQREWNVQHQPAMQPVVIADLPAELAFLFADFFQILDNAVEIARQQHPQTFKDSGGFGPTGEGWVMDAFVLQERAHRSTVKIAQRGCRGGDGCRRCRARLLAGNGLGWLGSQRPANRLHHFIGLGDQLGSNAIDLLEDCFHRDSCGHQRRHVMLQNGAEYSADNHDYQQHHEHGSEEAAKSEPGVEENYWQAQRSQPQMAAHPGLRAA